MMPPKRTGNGASGEMRKMNLLTQTTIINYSIIMRSVNANLLAINQAKSRINQAKKEGKTSVGLNAPTTQEGGGDGTSGDGTSGGGSATGGSENTGGSDVDIYVEMPTQVFPCGLSESIP